MPAIELRASRNTVIVTTAFETLDAVQRLRPALRDATLSCAWSDVQTDANGIPLGVDGLMHVVTAHRHILVVLSFMDQQAEPEEMMLPCAPPVAVEGLGYGTMLRVDAVRLVVAVECAHLLGNGADYEVADLLEKLGLAPDMVASAAEQFGAAIRCLQPLPVWSNA